MWFATHRYYNTGIDFVLLWVLYWHGEPKYFSKYTIRKRNISWMQNDGESNSLALLKLKLKEIKLCGFNPQAKYTDRATPACRRS
jgi:hypothetical protein